jgi:small ligand-binding sensory domain FIST
MSAGVGALRAGSGLGLGQDWRRALGVALEAALAPLEGDAPDLLVLFASASYRQAYAELLAEAADRARATEVAGGCRGAGAAPTARIAAQRAARVGRGG